MIVIDEFDIGVRSETLFLEHLSGRGVDGASRSRYGHGLSFELLDRSDSLHTPYLKYKLLHVCAKIFHPCPAEPSGYQKRPVYEQVDLL